MMHYFVFVIAYNTVDTECACHKVDANNLEIESSVLSLLLIILNSYFKTWLMGKRKPGLLVPAHTCTRRLLSTVPFSCKPVPAYNSAGSLGDQLVRNFMEIDGILF